VHGLASCGELGIAPAARQEKAEGLAHFRLAAPRAYYLGDASSVILQSVSKGFNSTHCDSSLGTSYRGPKWTICPFAFKKPGMLELASYICAAGQANLFEIRGDTYEYQSLD